jgi:hypothetical protein
VERHFPIGLRKPREVRELWIDNVVFAVAQWTIKRTPAQDKPAGAVAVDGIEQRTLRA